MAGQASKPPSDSGEQVAETGPRTTPLERATRGEATSADVAAWRAMEASDVIRERYVLREPLGHGGMGSVWIAHDTFLEVDVALKFLRPEVPAEYRVMAAKRMLSEARATARLVHPSILRLHDVGETLAGQPYIVMELLEGVDLCAYTDDGRDVLPAERAVQLLLPILDALGYAHAQGVVHRDVKPENIFLCQARRGAIEPKLIDFGIARHTTEEADLRLTRPGALLGSPFYMSPEQGAGEAADERSDLWSISVVLYELLTGTPPFHGKNTLALVRAVIDEEPSPLADRGVDTSLSAIVMRGLNKDRAYRWQDAKSYGVALARWLAGRGHDQDASGTPLAHWLEEVPEETLRLTSSSRSSRAGTSTGFGSLPPMSHTRAEVPASRPRGRWLAVAAATLVIGVTGAARWVTSKRPTERAVAVAATPRPIVVPSAVDVSPEEPKAAPAATAVAQEQRPSAPSVGKPNPAPRSVLPPAKSRAASTTIVPSPAKPPTTDVYDNQRPLPQPEAPSKPKLMRPNYD